MKKILAVVISMLLSIGIFCSVSAEGGRDMTSAISYAESLRELGLFLGTENGFALEKTMTRAEAVTMLVRILGKEAEAEAYGKTHPFSDVAPWADGYVSYAYDAGLTNGISDTLFGADNAVESNMYLTFLLRAMGYADNKDFIWQMPYALAAELEMLPPETELLDFRRGDAVTFTAAALFASCKNGAALHEKLTEDGAFGAEAWESAFPEDPFTVYRAQNRAVGEAVQAESGETKLNSYCFYNHILLDVVEKGEYAEATVATHHARFTVNEANEITGSGSGSSVRYLFLEKSTWAVAGEEEGRGYRLSDHFPESALGATNNYIWQGMNMRLGVETDKIIASGALSYKAPTYEQSLAIYYTEDTSSLYSIQARLETEQCTVISGYLAGVPHGPAGFISLIYKPGAAVGEGKVVSLPLPPISAWGSTELPEDLTLSEDGKTLTYSFYFDSDLKLKIDGEVERVVHEAGTYHYTTDLLTGETKLEIVK